MKKIDSKLFINMFEGGCKFIAVNCDYMNELNVFPVPDGDTGTNMKITTTSAIENVKANITDQSNLYDITKLLARQLLMNARGNSGVIFSQIFRGFFDPIKEDTKEIDINLFIECLIAAKEKAYKSISNPVEGTILTIIRVVSEEVVKKTYNNTLELLENVTKIALDALKKTPNMLPSLKEAKVVDSGGYGLCKFFEGMLQVLSGKETLDDQEIKQASSEIKDISTNSKTTFITNPSRFEISEEGFGYCCEFIIQLNFKTTETQKAKVKWVKNIFEQELLEHGDSLIIVNDAEIVKVHVHSLYPYKIFEIGQKYGEFLKIKVDNMTKQFLDNHPEISPKELFKKFRMTNDIKIVATVPTESLAQYYDSQFNINNTIITEMIGNPSTNDLLTGIKTANSTNIIIVTDDSNIILSAEQAAILYKDKANVQIARCKNTMESIFACTVFNPNISVFDNIKEINKIIKKSFTGLLSTSVKTAQFGDVLVEKGDFIGIVDKKIILAEKNSEIGVISLIKKLVSRIRKPKIVYIVYGLDVTTREIRNIEKFVNESYGIKCKNIKGDQKLYKYFVGVQ
ncbi:DAK2 domain-containing protein [Malacoplasma muris]|uniref:DAK2 domain-containing protein n=1 Tax=Malacoplasma muris TaxID=2119 RepID=UPI00398ED496